MSLVFDENGLRIQTQAEIVEEMAAKLRALPQYGPNVKTDPKSQIGGVLHLFSEMRALDQQVWLSVYGSFNPDNAHGRALDARCALTGTKRPKGTPSSVVGILTFAAAGTAPQGMFIKNSANNSVWKLINGPLTVVAPGTIAAIFQCITNGPVLANSGTTWSIMTTVPHLTSFTNPSADAKLGRIRAQDPELRKKRLTELYAPGQGPLATIGAKVSKVNGVLSVRVYHNQTEQPSDANGIPFKAFNVVAETSPAVPDAGLRQAIWNAIWAATGAGGSAYGTSYAGTVIDSEGQIQPSAFDVVADVETKLEIDLVTSTTEDPISDNIEAVVAAQILAVAQDKHEVVGRDVRSLDYKGFVQQMLSAGTISGVDDVVVRLCRVSTPPAAVVAKVAMGIREKAKFSTGNIVVGQV